MSDFFPTGFWPGMAMFWMAVFFLFGIDLIVFKARFAIGLGQYVNKKVHVDSLVVRMLEALKKGSDTEVMKDSAFLRGWGRFVAGGVLVTAAFLVFRILPDLK
jgi:hypothetical protein